MTWGSVELGAHLGALGMPLAFSRLEADFSGINGHAPPHEDSLFISAVFHKAFVEMDEEGTEAAAATGAALEFRASRPQRQLPVPVFRADHPFLFAIRDRQSGAVLFLGRVSDPTSEI
jgi:serpin B